MAILDSGATSNFLTIDAHTVAIIPTDNPINVTLLEGRKVQSMHKCTLDLQPDLPIAARNGHIIPGLAENSLLSAVVLCNARCEVTFNKYDVTVKYNGKTVFRGTKCTRTGLWLVPLQSKATQEATDGVSDPVTNLFPDLKLNAVTQEHGTTHTVANVATVLNTSSMEELATYHHQSLGSPSKNAIYR